MPDPTIAARFPAVLELDAGTYWWCACGQSKNQPFCDGSHAGTAFSPVEFTMDQKTKCALCQCKHTASQPMCDGTHKRV